TRISGLLRRFRRHGPRRVFLRPCPPPIPRRRTPRHVADVLLRRGRVGGPGLRPAARTLHARAGRSRAPKLCRRAASLRTDLALELEERLEDERAAGARSLGG